MHGLRSLIIHLQLNNASFQYCEEIKLSTVVTTFKGEKGNIFAVLKGKN